MAEALFFTMPLPFFVLGCLNCAIAFNQIVICFGIPLSYSGEISPIIRGLR